MHKQLSDVSAGSPCDTFAVRILQSWPLDLGHFLIFPQTEHFSVSHLPLGNVDFQESRIWHKYSTVKGRQHCLGGAEGKSFYGYFYECKLLVSPNFCVKSENKDMQVYQTLLARIVCGRMWSLTRAYGNCGDLLHAVTVSFMWKVYPQPRSQGPLSTSRK